MDFSAANDHSKQETSVINSSYLYEYAPCGHVSFNPNGYISSINHTMLSWLNLSKEDVFKKRFNDILSKAGQFYYQMIVFPLLNMQGAVNEISFDIQTGNNNTFPCLFNAVAVKDQNKTVTAIHTTIIKITDRKKYESELLNQKRQANDEKKRLEFLANIIPNLIFTASPLGKIDFLNARFYEYFNDSENNLAENSFLNLVHKEDRYNVFRLWITCLKEGKTFGAEIRLRNISGEYEWFLIRAVPYINETGLISTWYGSCTNIHEQKEKQALVVNALNRSLSTAGETISNNKVIFNEIAFDQAHLIRMPLSNILGLIHLMETIEMDEQMQKIHELLKRSSVQLDEVVKRIVDKTYFTDNV